MKFKFLPVVVALLFAVTLFSCTPLQQSTSDDEYYTTNNVRTTPNRIYVDDPYQGTVVLERDPWSGRYYQVYPNGYTSRSRYSNAYPGGYYNNRPYTNNGGNYRNNGGNYRRYNSSSNSNTQQQQQPVTEDRQKQREEARRKILGGNQ